MISDLQSELRDFAAERDWEQFHVPKNLVMALSAEAGELTEIFQWLTPDQAAGVMSDPEAAGHVEDELADVLAYLLRLADVLGVDLAQALHSKIQKNAAKYPADLARGTAVKYTALPPQDMS
jgi:dCTP diphosphatase